MLSRLIQIARLHFADLKQLSGPLNVRYEFYIVTKDTFCELTECELSAPCHRCNSCHTDHNDVPPDKKFFVSFKRKSEPAMKHRQ